jgi:hypothetical protein
MNIVLHNPHILMLAAGIAFAMFGLGVWGLAMAWKELRK